MKDEVKEVNVSEVNPESWQQVKNIFFEVLDKPESERAEFLAAACAGSSAELKKEVEALLAAHFDSESFIENPVFELPSIFKPVDDADRGGSNDSDGGSPNLGKHFGHYKIIREIGVGGMGAVFLAERDDGEFKQQVAIKIIRHSFADSQIIERFKRERQILASLNHPNVARLLDGGVTADGLPFIAMEYIDGQAITQYAEENNLSIRERLELFLKVCAGVSHAHRNLIVHRDLKPSNIFVTPDGTPKLLDFGLAKLTAGNLDGNESETVTAFRALTPAYASPEQLRGEAITTASDIYSLGVVLYQLLTGSRPFHFKNQSLNEVINVVCGTEPIRPSSVVTKRINDSETQKRKPEDTADSERADAPSAPASSTTAAAASSLPFSRSELKGDVDNIVLKALRKEPVRRYSSVEQFAADIDKYLKGLPISARPNTFAYRAEKFVKRNKLSVSAAAIVLLSLITGIITTAYQSRVAARERDKAIASQIKAERLNKFLQQMLSFSDQSFRSVSPVAQTKNVTVNEMLDQITPRIEADLADQPEARAQVLRTIGNAYASQGHYELAANNLRQALEIQIQVLGEDTLEVAETRAQLGLVTFRQLKFDEAGDLLEKAVAFHRRRQADSPDFSPGEFALALDYLGAVKLYQGDSPTAVLLINEGLEVAQNADLQENDRSIIPYLKGELGYVLSLTGNTEKSEALFREAVAEWHQIPGAPRWEYGATLTGFGMLLTSRGQTDEAARILAEGETIYRRTLGDKNPYLATNIQQQAAVFVLANNLPAAEAKARESIAIMKEAFPGNDAVLGPPMIVLGSILTKERKFAEAADNLREGIKKFEILNLKRPQSIVQAKLNLTECLLAQNKLDEAEKIALEAYDQATRALGEQSPLVKKAAASVTKVYEKQGKPELAAKYRQTVAIAQ